MMRAAEFIIFLVILTASLWMPEPVYASLFYPVLMVCAGLVFIALQLRPQSLVANKSTRRERIITILSAVLATAYAVLYWFNPAPARNFKTSYAQLLEDRHKKDALAIAAQLSDFAARTGAVTNEWSLPGASGLRGPATPLTALAVQEAFAHPPDTLVVAVFPRELKFSAGDNLPPNFKNLFAGLHLRHTLTDATLEVQVAVKDNFWQMVQLGHGNATELLVALRGIQLDKKLFPWSTKPALILKGRADTVQWLEPAASP